VDQLDAYRKMLLIRFFEEEIYKLNKLGLLQGTAHLYIGMEAIAVGACTTMLNGDYLTSTHRGHGHGIACGLDTGRMMAEILGRVDGYCGGKGGSMHIADISHGMLGADGIVGGGIPIAVGAAVGSRLKAESSVVLCFFGEGATNQGSFHEGLNFAAVQKLPVVFICENNLWALSASFKEFTAGGSVAARAAGYGIPGARVDGNNVTAVFEAVAVAARRARQGLGPSLLECETYRWEGHSIFTRQDNRPDEEILHWKNRDPIQQYRNKLVETHAYPIQTLLEVEAQVGTQISNAAEYAKNSPMPDPGSALEHVFA